MSQDFRDGMGIFSELGYEMHNEYTPHLQLYPLKHPNKDQRARLKALGFIVKRNIDTGRLMWIYSNPEAS